MPSLFSSPPKVKKPAPPPLPTDPEIQSKEAEARKRMLLASGRDSTILTQSGSQGLGFVG